MSPGVKVHHRKFIRDSGGLDGGGTVNKIFIYHNPDGSSTFDPTIETSIATTVIWYTELGQTITTGTTHNISYVPGVGAKKCGVSVQGGLDKVTVVTCPDDNITSIMSKPMNGLVTFSLPTNVSLVQLLSKVMKSVTTLNLMDDVLVQGDLADVANVSNSLILSNCALVTGSLPSLNVGLRTCHLNGVPLVSASSIASLIALEDIRLDDNGWSVGDVNGVIDGMWDARSNYTFGAPVMRIDGSNGVPSGTYGAPVVGSDWAIAYGMHFDWEMNSMWFFGVI